MKTMERSGGLRVSMWSAGPSVRAGAAGERPDQRDDVVPLAGLRDRVAAHQGQAAVHGAERVVRRGGRGGVVAQPGEPEQVAALLARVVDELVGEVAQR